ncbi:MAG: FliG C-terminal domain-containing protein [Planctomycetota bacterium]
MTKARRQRSSSPTENLQRSSISAAATIDQRASLRRVAIVLSSLPPESRDAIVGPLPPTVHRAVERAMLELSDVDPLERRDAIEAFRVSITETSVSPRTEETTKESTSSPIATSSGDANQAPEGPLSFIGQIDSGRVLEVLAEEHPQTIAVVLANVTPQFAASLLAGLPSHLQSETMVRIGRTDQIPTEMVEAVAASLRSKLEHPERPSSHGARRLHDILSVLGDQPGSPNPPDLAESVPSHFQPNTNGSIQDRFDAAMALVREQKDDSTGRAAPPKTKHQADQANRLKIHRDDNQDAEQAVPKNQPLASIPTSTDTIHQQLTNADPSVLCQALGQVSTEQAILALCGLPSKVADAVMACLPSPARKQVQQHLQQLPAVDLSDIDRAKEVVWKIWKQSIHESSSARAA